MCVRELQAERVSATLCDLPSERLGMDVVGKGLLTVDFDDRDQLPVPGLELRVAADVDLAQFEPQFLLKLAH